MLQLPAPCRPRRTGRGSVLVGLLALLVLIGAAPSARAASPSPVPTPAARPTSPGVPVPKGEDANRATFGIQPSNKRGPDFRPYFVYSVTPGSQVEDRVAVVNYSYRPITVRVYSSDAFNDRDGTFSLPERRIAAKEAGTWFRVGTDRRGRLVDVPARGFTVLPFTLRVPDEAGPGDHAAGLLASLAVRSDVSGGANVELDQRIATRVYLRVSGPLRPQLAVTPMRHDYHDRLNPFAPGRTTITYRVANTGNVTLGGPRGASVRGLLGPVARAAGLDEVPLLLPGGSVDLTAEVPRTWPLLLLRSTLTVEAGGVGGQSDAAALRFTGGGRFVAVPWTLLALVAAACAGMLYWRHRRRRRGAPGEAVRPGRHARGAAERAGSSAVMTSNENRARAVLPALAALVLLVLGLPTPAHADGIGYVDPNVTGAVGLCDAQGRNVRSGKVTDKPFLVRAVGNTAAPAPYDAPGRTAFLTAFQPRPGVDPGEWSGYTVMTASTYSNPAHPMVQGSPIGGSLQEFLGRFPPQWDGLVQLRLFLSGSERSPRTDAYDATDLRVVGDTWTVVRGGDGPCTAGDAVSRSALLNVPGARGTIPPGAIASPPAVTSAPEPVLTGAAAASAAASLAAAPTAGTPGAGGTGDGAGTGPLLLGAVALVVVAGGVTALVLRRSKAQTPAP